MKTAQSLELIYKEILRLKGKEKAADYMSALVYNMFHELEENGNVSAGSIESSLVEEAEICAASSKKDVA